jgi:hypothetical protein
VLPDDKQRGAVLTGICVELITYDIRHNALKYLSSASTEGGPLERRNRAHSLLNSSPP